jgi:hypothetical protein
MAVIPPPVGLHHAALVYTDPLFQVTSELARRVSQSGRFRGVLGAILRHPLMVCGIMIGIWRLPVIEVTINRRQATAWFARRFPIVGEPIFGGRRAQAVLDLDADSEQYLAGRRKQALRTNLRHARQLGVQVQRVATYDEWFVAAREILRYRPDGQELIRQMQPTPPWQDMGYFVATDHEGRAVAFSLVAIFNDCAVLVWSLSLHHHPAGSSARYLLHTMMRSELRDRGVRHLIAGSAVRESAGLQYFQYLLGYEVRNLKIAVRGAVEPELVPALETGPEPAVA